MRKVAIGGAPVRAVAAAADLVPATETLRRAALGNKGSTVARDNKQTTKVRVVAAAAAQMDLMRAAPRAVTVAQDTTLRRFVAKAQRPHFTQVAVVVVEHQVAQVVQVEAAIVAQQVQPIQVVAVVVALLWLVLVQQVVRASC